MRYIGNKTRLLPFIRRVVRTLGIQPGVVHDAFAGTAAVGRALKEDGWRVAASDVMTYSYVLQRAYVETSAVPSLAALHAGDADFRRACRSPALRARAAERGGGGRLAVLAEYLATCEEPGFVTGHFSPAGGRMYFTEENARRIDGARARLHEWRRAGLLDDDAYFLLLASVIEGADRVANTAGVYAAFIKKWQPNALRSFAALPEPPVRGAGSVAHCADAAEVARRIGPVDLLYVDPPYNSRQYSGYYHVPEILARGWFGERPPVLRGKTGLLAEPVPRSAWCSARRVREALRELLGATGARHLLVSYNSEGLLPAPALRAELAEAAVDGKVRQFVRQYRRYRSDSDGPRRRYRGTEVRELLYYARLR